MQFAAWLSKLCSLGEIRLSAGWSELGGAIDSSDALFPACCNAVSAYRWPFISHILCRDHVIKTSDSQVLTLDASSSRMLYFFFPRRTHKSSRLDWGKGRVPQGCRNAGQMVPALQELHKINGSGGQVQMDREEPQNSHNVVRDEGFAGLVLALIRSPKHFTALSQTPDSAGSDEVTRGGKTGSEAHFMLVLLLTASEFEATCTGDTVIPLKHS